MDITKLIVKEDRNIVFLLKQINYGSNFHP